MLKRLSYADSKVLGLVSGILVGLVIVLFYLMRAICPDALFPFIISGVLGALTGFFIALPEVSFAPNVFKNKPAIGTFLGGIIGIVTVLTTLENITDLSGPWNTVIFSGLSALVIFIAVIFIMVSMFSSAGNDYLDDGL